MTPFPVHVKQARKNQKKHIMDSMGINNDGTIEWECLIWTRDGIEPFDPPRIGGRKAT